MLLPSTMLDVIALGPAGEGSDGNRLMCFVDRPAVRAGCMAALHRPPAACLSLTLRQHSAADLVLCPNPQRTANPL